MLLMAGSCNRINEAVRFRFPPRWITVGMVFQWWRQGMSDKTVNQAFDITCMYFFIGIIKSSGLLLQFVSRFAWYIDVLKQNEFQKDNRIVWWSYCHLILYHHSPSVAGKPRKQREKAHGKHRENCPTLLFCVSLCCNKNLVRTILKKANTVKKRYHFNDYELIWLNK